MIPKRIHQVWIGDQSKRPVDLLNSIREMNPTWEYTLWTEENLPDDLRLQELIDAVPHNDYTAKCDLIRYELLYRYGGFYVDADSLALRPFPDELLDNDSFAVWDNEYAYPGYIANGYMGSTQGNYFIGRLIETFLEKGVEYIKSMGVGYAAQTTGPWALTKLVQSMRYNNMTIYPSHYFIPVHYTGLVSPLRKYSYCEHYGGSTRSSRFWYTSNTS
jgi:mannosyltransferase OCH1-like enzyme